MDDARRVRWRIDATTSRTVRVLWALGAGTLLAAITLIVFARLLAISDEAGGEPVLYGALVVVVVTILALAVGGGPGARVAALRRRLPTSASTTGGSAGSDDSAEVVPGDGDEGSRAMDAAVGAVAGGAVIVALARGVGGGVGHGAAALTIPLALVAVVVSSFVQSVGAFDPDERKIRLAEPEAGIDLEVIRAVSVREFGDLAVLSLEYREPGGQYVPGPRRLVVPPAVARDVRAVVEDSR